MSGSAKAADADEVPGIRAPRSFVVPPARAWAWSVRRELWEHRSVVIAPLGAGALVLIGVLIGAIHLAPAKWALDPASPRAVLAAPYGLDAVAILLTAVLTGFAYCLGALHGERRDRSILFWKSLPVSDTATVLAKAAIPLVVLPFIATVTIVLVQLLILLLATVILSLEGVDPAPLWTALPLVRMDGVLIYFVSASVLWYAPIFTWLLLVSAWAQRATFLWAVLPPLALGGVEWIALRTTTVLELLGHRLVGSFPSAFDLPGAGAPDAFPQPDAAKFVATPGLWIGLTAAAGFLGASIWLRRHRDPI